MRPLIRRSQIQAALEILKNGGLVVIPTETVYGLAADAANEHAVKKIFSVKGRPDDHPIIVHLAHIDQLKDWAHTIPDYALTLAKHFWPGPMTLILKKQDHVSKTLTGGQESIGIRIPSHPVAQALLQQFKGGLAAPSANRFGYISPTHSTHVQQDLGDKVDMILEGGHCGIGIESTIIDCTGDAPRILRPGMITQDMIDDVLTSDLACTNHASTQAPRVSGNLASHYAPRTKTMLLPIETLDARLEDKKNIVVLSTRKAQQHRVKIIDARIPHRQVQSNPDINHWIIMPSDPHAYAHRLYEQLHFADALNCDEIWIEDVPNTLAWSGIRDRIKKASFGT